MSELQSLRGALIRRLIRRGNHPDDAEDIVHEALVRLYVAQKKQHVRNHTAFLTDVVGKVRIERWRVAQRHGRFLVDEPVEELTSSTPRRGRKNGSRPNSDSINSGSASAP